MPHREVEAPVLVLANPKSGGGLAGELVPYLVQGLNREGHAVEVFQSAAAGQITARVAAMEGSYHALCIVGGDGTVREALQARPPRNLPVAVLPAGTSNVLAQEFRLAKNPLECARTIVRRQTRTLDLGVIERSDTPRHEVMVLMIGAGIDSQIIERAHQKRRGSTFGKLAYIGPIARSLFSYEKIEHSFILEDGTRHGPFAQVVVANIAGYGGLWRMPGDVRYDDGLFDCYGFKASRALCLLRHGLLGALKKLEEGEDLVHFQASRVRIEADRPSPVQCDGDPAGMCPLDVRVVPRALELIVDEERRTHSSAKPRQGST